MAIPAWRRWVDRSAEVYECDGGDLTSVVDRSLRAKASTDTIIFAFAQVRLLERIAAVLEKLEAQGRGRR